MHKSLLLLVPALLCCGLSAHADSISFNLTQDACSGGCGTAPFGTITLTQTSATTVTVTETLKSGEVYAGTGAGDSLAFSLNLAPSSVVIGDLTSGFTVDSTPKGYQNDVFEFGVDCGGSGGACVHGTSADYSGPFSFTVSDPSGILLSDFVADPSGIYFSSDIGGVANAHGARNTGNVAAIGSIPTVAQTPEPSSLMLLGTGVLSAAGLLRRRALVS